MCVSSCDKRCHTEVGAPAEQDWRSLVVRNMSRRPRTETSTLVLGPVVTALLPVYQITMESTRRACAAHTPLPCTLVPLVHRVLPRPAVWTRLSDRIRTKIYPSASSVLDRPMGSVWGSSF